MRYVPVLASAVAAVLLAGCGADPAPPAAALSVTSAATPTPKAAKREAVADPARIQIPAIGVDAKLVRLGMKKRGVMDVPDPTFAGWYTGKPAVRPGENGPAVIAAHVDSATGPDVFYRLREMKDGDRIVVTDTKGQKHEFTFAKRLQTSKTDLPAGQIFGSTDGPTLRLITCAGDFDRKTRHYRDNLTIFANAA